MKQDYSEKVLAKFNMIDRKIISTNLAQKFILSL